ncbi:MAG: alanine racemase [Sandaracinaceae bacterium]|nr:alanine racemase [Sandaracinaceae bacterium]
MKLYAPPLILKPGLLTSKDCLRPTRAEIDLETIASNLRVIRRHLGETKIIAVVKADAYGHGVEPVALRLQECGVDGFGVALAEEGIELRQAGIEVPVLILNGVHGDAHRAMIEYKLTPVLYELREAQAFQAAAKTGERVAAHLKIDTGMSRLGVPLRSLPAFLEELKKFPAIQLTGAMTHLADAEGDEETTRAQLARFEEGIKLLRAYGHDPHVIHTGNTAGALRFSETRGSWARIGIGLYGFSLHAGYESELELAMRLRTEIISIRTILPGERVGYSGTFTAKRETKVATLALGYGDGLPRGLSNRGHALVRGIRCPIIGNISMDLTGIDVTAIPDVELGEEAVLFGRQGESVLTLGEVASAAGILPYEVLTNVSRRVPRFYLAKNAEAGEDS